MSYYVGIRPKICGAKNMQTNFIWCLYMKFPGSYSFHGNIIHFVFPEVDSAVLLYNT